MLTSADTLPRRAGALSLELEALGVQAHDPLDKFWKTFGERMQLLIPEAAACALDISKKVAEYGIITVGGMTELAVHEMQECITEGGGSAKWAKSVQRLLGKDLKETIAPPPAAAPAAKPPASAALVKTMTTGVARFPNVKLGEYLVQHSLLLMCILPKEKLIAAVKETKDPEHNTLSYNDTSRVVEVCFLFIATTYANVGNCKVLFDHLVEQLQKQFAAPHGKTGWYKKLENRWEGARKADASKRNRHMSIDQDVFDSMGEDAKFLISDSRFHLPVKSADERVRPLALLSPAAETSDEVAHVTAPSIDAPAEPPAAAPAPAQTAAQLRKVPPARKAVALKDLSNTISATAAALTPAAPAPPCAAPMPTFAGKPAAAQLPPAAPPAMPAAKPKRPPAKPTAAKKPSAKKPPAKKPPAKKTPVVQQDSNDSSGNEESEASDGESDDSEEEPTYLIEAIVRERVNGRASEFLVQWEGYKGQDTWEPRAALKDNSVFKEYIKNKALVKTGATRPAPAAPPATDVPPAPTSVVPTPPIVPVPLITPAPPVAPATTAPLVVTAPPLLVPVPDLATDTSRVTISRGFTIREDGEKETRLRKRATDETHESDFLDESIGWIPNEMEVDVLETALSESGATFYHIKAVQKGQDVCGYLRAKYIRASGISGERAAKRQRSC